MEPSPATASSPTGRTQQIPTPRRAHFVEDEPEIVPAPSRARSKNQGQVRRGGDARGKQKAVEEDKIPAAVFYDDDDDDDDDGPPEPEKYTFYREDSPTPSGEVRHEQQQPQEREFATTKEAVLSSPTTATISTDTAPSPRLADDGGFPFRNISNNNHGGRGGHNLASGFEESETGSHRTLTVCGIRRWVLCLLVALAVFLALGIGLGVGIGVGWAKRLQSSEASNSSPSSAATATAASVNASSATSILPNSTMSMTSAATATATANTLTGCPGVNATTYAVPNSTVTFLRVCGVDYSGAGGATDLVVVETDGMDGCMASCAAYDGCTGCSWGPVANDTGDAHRCWLKNDLGEAHAANDDWIFGLLQT